MKLTEKKFTLKWLEAEVVTEPYNNMIQAYI